MRQREVQQSLKKVIARKESCNARTGSGACLPQPPAKSGPQSSSALIGLLCRPTVTTRPTTSPPGRRAEATSACTKSQRTLAAAGDDTCASREHSGSADGQPTSTPSTTAAPSWQECPLCQQPIPSHDLQRHINAELDGMMSASTSSHPAAGASLSLQASARSTHLQEAAKAEQRPGEAEPAGSRSSALPHSSVERWNSTTGSGLPPGMQSLGSCSNRGATKRQQHSSQQAQRLVDRGVPSDPSTGRPLAHTSMNILDRQLAPAAHGSNLRQGHSGMVVSAEACRRQCSREDSEMTGARSGAAQSGPGHDALQGRKRPKNRLKPPLPSAKVLILGAGKLDQQRNPDLKRVKPRASRVQPGRAASASFDHYQNGHGFWDSSMLGLDGAENLGTHMWEGFGTATWSGLGPP
ncbi:hypothetical protein COCOBI_09-0550 [Coccomyxa sp. Obi]|nr:hypothetical protein COCOBI_09-0550 [Coccomyxa sp. Obi]